MEELDEPIARAIHHEMAHADRARVFSSREHDASRMTALLRRLGVLVTSRYHASVLSLAAAVPQLAVGHDLRLRTLYSELGIEDRYFLTPDEPDVFDRMTDAVDELLSDPVEVRERLRAGHDAHLAAARRNRELLRSFAGRARVGGAGMGDVVLLTGGTGFLGTEVAARLLERADLEIVSLVLADTDAEAARARRTGPGGIQPDLRAELGARIHAIAGDVAEADGWVSTRGTYADLCDRVTHIVHCRGRPAGRCDRRGAARHERRRGGERPRLRAVGPQTRASRPRVDRVRGRGSDGHRERGRPDRRLRLREPVRADEVRGRAPGPRRRLGAPGHDRPALDDRRRLEDGRHQDVQHLLRAAAAVPVGQAPDRPGETRPSRQHRAGRLRRRTRSSA